MGKIINVREVGDPVLNKMSEEVDITNINSDVLDIIDDLKATLEDGVGVGIAAPQIGINKRIIVVGDNPKWKKSSDETDIQFEACLSVPAIAGKVERFKHITLQYYNEQGEKIEKEIHGFFARLIQHECDHLDGFTLLNRVREKDGFATKENRKKYNL